MWVGEHNHRERRFGHHSGCGGGRGQPRREDEGGVVEHRGASGWAGHGAECRGRGERGDAMVARVGAGNVRGV
jgi:hypothetical protein